MQCSENGFLDEAYTVRIGWDVGSNICKRPRCLGVHLDRGVNAQDRVYEMVAGMTDA